MDHVLRHMRPVNTLFLSYLLKFRLPIYDFVSHIFLPLSFSTSIVCTFLVSPTCATITLHYTILYPTNLIIFF